MSRLLLRSLQLGARRSARPPRVLRAATGLRGLATASDVLEKDSDSPFRVSTVLTILLATGGAAVAYGVYDIYNTFTMWPTEVRGDLRAALTAKNQENFELSERYFHHAWQTARTLSPGAFKGDPQIMISGLAIALGEVYEMHNLADKAYAVYKEAYKDLETHSAGPVRLRAAALASKLGEMAEIFQQPEEEEERWLVLAVEQLLQAVRPYIKTPHIDDAPKDLDSALLLSELSLPKWASSDDIGAPLEALGAFYARAGKIDYAMPLYLQAISILIPSQASGKHSSPENRCRGAQLMNNLAALIMTGPPTPEKLDQAEAWAKQGLGILEKTRQQSAQPIRLCEHALAAAYFSLGAFREMADDRPAARSWLTKALDHSRSVGMREGIVEAQIALRRLARLDQTVNRISPISPVASRQDKK